MVFLFNQTGEDLKLRCDVKELEDGANEMNIAVVFPNQSYVNLLHTRNAAIIKAAKTRFRLGVADFQPNHPVGHDFYISKKVAGYDIENVTDGTMAEIIPCDVNPSKDRDTIRNLVVAVFKRDEMKTPNLRTYDTNDTTLTKIEAITLCEKDATSVYEFHFVAIKWVGWFRLKRPSYLIVDDGNKPAYYMLSSIDSKMKANIKNDWLLPLSDDEAEMMLAAAKAEEGKRAEVKHVQGARKPQSQRPQQNRQNQNYRNSNNRKGNGGQNRNGSNNYHGNSYKGGQGRSNNQQRSNSNGNYRNNNNRSSNGGYQKKRNNNSFYRKKDY